jgi:hypothetical protein
LTKPPLHRSRFYSRHYPFYLRAVPSRNKTETPEASILPNGRKSRQPIRLVVEGPKGLRIGLYYCFLPKEFQSASSHPPHIPSTFTVHPPQALLPQARRSLSRPVSLSSQHLLRSSADTHSLLNDQFPFKHTLSPFIRSPTPARFPSKTPGVHNDQSKLVLDLLLLPDHFSH